MISEKEYEIELIKCFSIVDDFRKKAICFHRLSCRKACCEMSYDQKLEICKEISDISMRYPIHDMTRGNMKESELFELKSYPDKKFSGLELTAWFFELMNQITNGKSDEMLNH